MPSSCQPTTSQGLAGASSAGPPSPPCFGGSRWRGWARGLWWCSRQTPPGHWCHQWIHEAGSEVKWSCSVVPDSLRPHGQWSAPSSSVHGIFQARVLEWVATSFSRESSQPRNWTWVSCTEGRFLTNWTTGDYLCSKNTVMISFYFLHLLLALWLEVYTHRIVILFCWTDLLLV